MKKLFALLALSLLTMSAWAANTYVKVASVDQLEIGKKYIIVNEAANVGMGALSNTSTVYGTTAAITIDNGVVDIDGTDVLELTAHKANGDQGGWIFEFDENHFIAWVSGNSLTSTHNTTGVASLNEQWYATANDDGVILKNRNDLTRILQYNSTSPRFACYTSSQKPAVLYVQDENVTPPVTVAPPTLPESQEFENSFSVTITNNEEGADLMYALNDGEFVDYEGAFTITETTTVRAKAVKGDVESEEVTATYTKVEPVVLINPYVKVTSVDQLEIGKKYILVNEENSRAMGALSNTSTVYGTAEAITIDNEVVDINGTSVLELTAHKANGDQGGWIFEFDENHFIAWVSGNSLTSTHNTTGVASINEQWYADATDDGVILKNRNDLTRILQYNSTSPRFACYTSSQKPAVLYMEYVPEEEGIATLAEANALENDEAFAFGGNAVVTVHKNGYLFLRDESGFGQIREVTEGEFVNGQVLNPNWEAVKAGNDGWDWFVEASGLSASDETNDELAAPIVLTGAVDESMLNAYVCIENQKPSGGFIPLPARYYTLPDNTTISKSDILWAVNADASTVPYNVYGIIVKGNDGTLMINPVDFAPYVEPEPEGLRGDVNMDNEVNIRDVTALINYLLSRDATGISLENANCNLDGEVNITDVTVLINYLLSKTW